MLVRTTRLRIALTLLCILAASVAAISIYIHIYIGMHPFLVEGDKTNTNRFPPSIVHRPLFTRHRVIVPTTFLITAPVKRMRANVSFSEGNKRHRVSPRTRVAYTYTICVLRY